MSEFSGSFNQPEELKPEFEANLEDSSKLNFKLPIEIAYVSEVIQKTELETETEISNENEQPPVPGKGYDLKIPKAMERHLPQWYKDIPWEKARERELPQEMIDTMYYMGRVEGHVCGGYLPIVLANPIIRNSTPHLDFAAGAWAPDQNGHSVALYTFLDLYEGRSESSRAQDLDQQRANLTLKSKIESTLTEVGARVAPKTFAAAYSVIGYRNEVMTMRGYSSLRTKVNEDGEHPVLSPMLHGIMKEEAQHAEMYKNLALGMLEGDESMQRVARGVLNKWTGLVGEDINSGPDADKVVKYLFEDANGRNLVKQVDELVGKLPGLEGVTTTQERLQEALKNG